MTELINIILVSILIIALVLPFIFIPVIIIYNSIVKRYELRVNIDINEKNVKAFIRVLSFGPMLKHDKKWEALSKTFYSVNKSDQVSTDSKNKLFDILIKKGCKLDKVKIN